MERLWQWKGWKTVCKTLCFFLLLVMALGRVNEVLALKNPNGLYTMQKFYEQPENTVDVLMLGSSHVYMNIEPGVLWSEYGVSSYDLGGGIQPMWNTFYYLKEALKTQRPKLIVMEAYMTTFAEEYGDNGRAVSNTFGMKWSWDKIEAMRLSAPPDKLSSFILSYTQYHARTQDLSREDFLENKGDEARYGYWKGSLPMLVTLDSYEWPTYLQTRERVSMAEKTEEWYRKTIELAQSAGVPLLIMVVPYPLVTEQQQAVYNTAADIALEYDVPFVNFHQDIEALGLDASKDYYDGLHLNIWGAKKFSQFLGNYLTDHYDLPDHRGDPDYQSWEANARYMSAYTRDTELALVVAPEEAASLLQNPDYTCAVIAGGNGGTVLAPLLEALGISSEREGAWLVSGGQILWSAGPEKPQQYFHLDWHDLKLSQNGMVFDRGNLKTVPNGVSILVYDAVTQAQAAFLTFDTAR